MRLRKYLAAICLLAVALLPGKAEAAKNYHGGQLYFGMGGSVCALNTKTGKVKKICEVLKTDTDPIGTIVYYKGNLYFSVDRGLSTTRSLLTLGRVYMIIIKSIISTLTVLNMIIIYLGLRKETRRMQEIGFALNLLYALLLALVWLG